MKRFSLNEPGVRVYGAPNFYIDGTFDRIQAEARKIMPQFDEWGLSRRCPGARIGFRTDSTQVKVHVELEKISPDIGMSIYACQSSNVFIGPRQTAVLAGLVVPKDGYNDTCAEQTFNKSSNTEDVMVWLPRNEKVKDVWFEIEDNARIEEPAPYKYPVPVVFYGSSITEGGCCSRLTNAYNAILSKRLDMDYVNMGFSGHAQGEPEMADYLCTFPMSALVMDYDYNAPTAEHLAATHEPFFKRVREHLPELPVLMLSCPDPEYREDGDERRAIVKRTYDNAVAAGDRNVYWIDGILLFGEKDRDMCVVDRVHPTDLGFYRMADVIEPVLKQMLDSKA